MRRTWILVLVCLLGGSASVSGGESRQIPPGPSVVAAGPLVRDTATNGVARKEMLQLVACLDAPRFESRNDASRELAAKGESAVPFLVEALADPSGEIRLRARLLLTNHNSFECVAPCLVGAVRKEYGSLVRVILRDRALLQIDEACQLPFADKLFKFWGTDVETYRDRAVARFTDAKNADEIAAAVVPLMGLGASLRQFDDTVSRLQALSLSYEHQHAPGYVIAETLARGLAQHHDQWIAFARQHLEALESLASGLQRKNEPKYAIRKEISDRATMSQGAAAFVVQLLDQGSAARSVVSQRMGISPEWLQQEFCRGLASPDWMECDRRVGKAHIVDMLTEALRAWPNAPQDGVVQKLISSVCATAREGNKPKALGFLDALDACHDLSRHRLDVNQGLGQRLAERLYAAAVDAPNNRVYHPARSVHNRIVKLIDLGISPGHNAFPQDLCENYLAKAEQSTSDEQRLALERYVSLLERLQTAGVGLDEPGSHRFALAMRDCLTKRHDLVAMGVTQLDRLVPAQPRGAKTDPREIDRALGDWTENTVAP